VICGWLVDASVDANTVLATAPLPLTVGIADGLSISPSNQPLAGRDFELNANFTTFDDNSTLGATIKPGNGNAGCAASRAADTGTPLNGDDVGVASRNHRDDIGAGMDLGAGSYLVCGWLYDGASVLAHSQTVLNVSKSRVSARLGSLGGSRLRFAITGLEAGYNVEVEASTLVLHAGTACPARYEALPRAATPDLTDTISETQRPSGNHNETFDAALGGPGRYLVCAYLEDASPPDPDHPTVVAGPVSIVLTVGRSVLFVGKTSQHRPLTISVNPTGFVSLVGYTAHLHCHGVARLANGTRWSDSIFSQLTQNNFGKVRATSGRFKLHAKASGHHTFTLSAKRSGKKLTGSFTEAGNVSAFTGNRRQHFSCTTGKVRFALKS
jgi:hypothetical protein